MPVPTSRIYKVCLLPLAAVKEEIKPLYFLVWFCVNARKKYLKHPKCGTQGKFITKAVQGRKEKPWKTEVLVEKQNQNVYEIGLE